MPDHQDPATSVCGVIAQYMGWNDEVLLEYQVFHYSPVADAFAVGGFTRNQNGHKGKTFLATYTAKETSTKPKMTTIKNQPASI